MSRNGKVWRADAASSYLGQFATRLEAARARRDYLERPNSTPDPEEADAGENERNAAVAEEEEKAQKSEGV